MCGVGQAYDYLEKGSYKSGDKLLKDTTAARTIQRQIVEASSVTDALRLGIEVMQSLGFYVQQAYPLGNSIKGVHGKDRDLRCAFKVIELENQTGKLKIWFNLHYGRSIVLDSKPYQVFFDLYNTEGRNHLTEVQ